MPLARWLKLVNFLMVVPLLAPPSIGVCSHCLAALSITRTISSNGTSSAQGGCSKCKSENQKQQSPAGGSCCSKNPLDSHGVAGWERSRQPALDFWGWYATQVELRDPARELAATALLDESPPPRGSPPVLQLTSLLRI